MCYFMLYVKFFKKKQKKTDLSFLHVNYQGKPLDNLSKQREAPESQQVLPPPSHSVSKKKERTSEEGSKAICRMALIAAIGSTRAISSTTNVPKTLTFVSPVETEVPSPASRDRRVVNINRSSPKPENKSEDNSTDQGDQWSSFLDFENIEGQGDHSEPKTDGRVS